MSIEQQLKEVIEKNLPQQVGETLKRRLEQLEKDSEELQKAKTKLETLDQKCEKLKLEITELSEQNASLKKREDNISQREASVAQKEVELPVTIAEIRAVEAEKRADMSERIVMKVFSSPVFRRTVDENDNYRHIREDIPLLDQYGCTQYRSMTKEVKSGSSSTTQETID